jgi:hypothetical protein
MEQAVNQFLLLKSSLWVARPESSKGVGSARTTPFEDSGRATMEVFEEEKHFSTGLSD